MGSNGANYLVNSTAAVGQAIFTTLRLFAGEWFLDLLAGVPWLQQIMGKSSQAIYDQILQNAIAGVEGVAQITAYSSSIDPTTRMLSVTATVLSIYGYVTISTQLPTAPTSGFGVGGYNLRGFGD